MSGKINLFDFGEAYELFRDAIDTWGCDLQLMVASEECAELIMAICKLRRKGGQNAEAIKRVTEEIADVEIMIWQLKLMLNCFEECAVVQREKMLRLKALLEKEKTK